MIARAGWALRPLLVALLLWGAVPCNRALALFPSADADCVTVPSTIIQVTLQQTTTCTADSVVQFPDIARATLYEVHWTHVASGTSTYQRLVPPFGQNILGQSPPAGMHWLDLSGNAGFTCADAIAGAADDWSDPQVFVNVLKPTVARFFFRGTGTPGEFFFDASLSTPAPKLVSYSWKFGDGTMGTGKTISHQYAAEGAHVVELTVKDTIGETATFTLTLVPRLAITQVLLDPTEPGTNEPFDLRVQVLNNGGTTITGVTPSAVLTPADLVHAGNGGPVPASAALPPATTLWFRLPAVATGEGEGTAVIDAVGTPVGAIRTVTRKFPIGGPVRARLTAPQSAAQGEQFQVSLEVTNQSGHVQVITPGALTVDAPAQVTVTGPVPAEAATLPIGAAATFTYQVTGVAAGVATLRTAVLAHDLSALTDTTLHPTLLVTIEGSVALTVTPMFDHPGIGQAGAVEVAITNATGEALTAVAVDFQIAAVSGDGAATVTMPGTVPSTIAGASVLIPWIVKSTHAGTVQFAATLTATGGTTHTPVLAAASGSFEIAAPTIGISGPLGGPLALGEAKANTDLPVVVTNFDPAAPVVIRWAGKQLATLTPDASGRATEKVRVGHFPTRESCSGLIQARQGDVVVDSGVQGSAGEDMASADGVEFSDGVAATKGPRCRGEVLVFPESEDYLFVGKPFGSNLSAERETLVNGELTIMPYGIVWVEGPGLHLPGIFTRVLTVERPRVGDGPVFAETFSFPYDLPPEFFASHDPFGKSGTANISESCGGSTSVKTGYLRYDGPLRWFIEPVRMEGAVFFVTQDLTFLGDGSDTPALSMQGSSLFVPQRLTVSGNVQVEPSPDGAPIFATALDVHRRSLHATCTKETAAANTNELAVDSNAAFTIGDQVTINPKQPNEETTAVVDFGSLILDPALRFDHQPGEAVVVTGAVNGPVGCNALSGTDARQCWCRRGLSPVACATQSLPHNLTTQFSRGCALLQTAADSGPKKMKRLLRSAAGRFKKVGALAAKAGKKHKLSTACAASVRSGAGL